MHSNFELYFCQNTLKYTFWGRCVWSVLSRKVMATKIFDTDTLDVDTAEFHS